MFKSYNLRANESAKEDNKRERGSGEANENINLSVSSKEQSWQQESWGNIKQSELQEWMLFSFEAIIINDLIVCSSYQTLLSSSKLIMISLSPFYNFNQSRLDRYQFVMKGKIYFKLDGRGQPTIQHNQTLPLTSVVQLTSTLQLIIRCKT